MLFMSSCAKDVSLNDICNDNEPCSFHIEYINVEIIDKQGNPVYYENSEYFTFRKSNSELIEVPKKEKNSNKKYNTYLVFSDFNIDETICEGDLFIFKIIQNNQVVISEEYLIGKNLCHIKMLKGKEIIVL